MGTRSDQPVRIDLRSGFFQISLRSVYFRYYGVQYQRQRLAWTRLPMGHPLALAIFQLLSTWAARPLHRVCWITNVANLDDRFLFST
jgi:hypothetical protein